MKTQPPRKTANAFTRIELLAVCTALALLALVVAPALATNKTDAERIVCFNNLRQIGRAVQMWAGDHNQQPPWRTLTTDGGLMPLTGTVPGNAWLEFSYISNQLVTPKILACPSDVGVKRAPDFSLFNGLLNVSYRNNAVSYVVGLESGGDSPRSWLSGDRNLGGINGFGAVCSTRISNAVAINSSLPPLAWTNGVVHGEFGHILLMDGSVEFTSTPRLRALLIPPQADDNGQIHFLRPRQ